MHTKKSGSNKNTNSKNSKRKLSKELVKEKKKAPKSKIQYQQVKNKKQNLSTGTIKQEKSIKNNPNYKYQKRHNLRKKQEQINKESQTQEHKINQTNNRKQDQINSSQKQEIQSENSSLTTSKPTEVKSANAGSGTSIFILDPAGLAESTQKLKNLETRFEEISESVNQYDFGNAEQFIKFKEVTKSIKNNIDMALIKIQNTYKLIDITIKSHEQLQSNAKFENSYDNSDYHSNNLISTINSSYSGNVPQDNPQEITSSFSAKSEQQIEAGKSEEEFQRLSDELNDDDDIDDSDFFLDDNNDFLNI